MLIMDLCLILSVFLLIAEYRCGGDQQAMASGGHAGQILSTAGPDIYQTSPHLPDWVSRSGRVGHRPMQPVTLQYI